MSRGACWGAVAVLMWVLAGCAAHRSPGAAPAAEAPPPAAPTEPADASYDYHNLIVAPFGTLLRQSPVPLHEVLLFHDEHAAPSDTDTKDCFAIDAPPPRFVGQEPDQYLLCFEHDHLSRIDVAVRLAADRADGVFARLCALWLKGTAPTAPTAPTAATVLTAPVPTAPGDTMCEGGDADIRFNARLAPVAGENTVPLSVTLRAAPRDPAHAP